MIENTCAIEYGIEVKVEAQWNVNEDEAYEYAKTHLLKQKHSGM